MTSPSTTPIDESAPTKMARRRPLKRRWWLPKFRLMDLIWIALVAAILMRWYQDRNELIRKHELVISGMSSRGGSWSVQQVTGAANTPSPGDQSTAWAHQTQDTQREWMIVEFPRSVRIKKIVVYETYNPGAIDRISTVSFKHDETDIWKGTDPTPTTAAMGLSSFPIKQNVTSRRIKLHLNSPAVQGWNEIDAVALHGHDGSVQWASDAWASSAYGENQELPSWFWP